MFYKMNSIEDWYGYQTIPGYIFLFVNLNLKEK